MPGNDFCSPQYYLPAGRKLEAGQRNARARISHGFKPLSRESFGVPDHTIGVGGSGGSIQQHLIAQNYPGLLDGIIPGASYPDPVTLVGPVTDCSLLNRAFEGNVHPWTPARKTAVSGFATRETCASWMRTYSPSMVEPHSCPSALPSDLAYDLERNPDGARCGFFDNVVNLIGCQTLAVAGIVD